MGHQERSRHPCSVKRSKVASGPGCLNQWLLPLPPDQGHQDWGSLQVPLWYVPWCRPYHGTPRILGINPCAPTSTSSLPFASCSASIAARAPPVFLWPYCALGVHNMYYPNYLPVFFFTQGLLPPLNGSGLKDMGASVQPMSVFSRSLFSWCKIYLPSRESNPT